MIAAAVDRVILASLDRFLMTTVSEIHIRILRFLDPDKTPDVALAAGGLVRVIGASVDSAFEVDFMAGRGPFREVVGFAFLTTRHVIVILAPEDPFWLFNTL